MQIKVKRGFDPARGYYTKNALHCWYMVLHTASLFAVFIMCGTPMDVMEVKNGSPEADSSDILFILIDLYKSVLFILSSLL